MVSPRTAAVGFLLLLTQFCVTPRASVIETDCISDELMSSAGNPSDEAGEILNAGERDFSVNLIKSLFKVSHYSLIYLLCKILPK